jgi:hypothetical protein
MARNWFAAPLIESCDRCGVRARVRVVLADGVLYFCQHYASEYQTALDQGAISLARLPL